MCFIYDSNSPTWKRESYYEQVNQWTPFKVQLVHVYMFMLHVHELLKRSPANSMQQLALKGLSSWIT